MNYDVPRSTRAATAVPRRDPTAYANWAAQRRAREVALRAARERSGLKRWERRLAKVFAFLVRSMGQGPRGERNARNVVLTRYDVHYRNLPPSFDGYRILHLTDLHLGHIDSTEAAVGACIDGVAADLCVMTGDYWEGYAGDVPDTARRIAAIAEAAAPRDGVLATLGNHDSVDLGAALEACGVPVLANESVHIRRGEARIEVVGTDDTWKFRTPEVDHAIAAATSPFKVLLTHTPELADVAAAAGYDLYFCGHTHGGQICLPGEIPIHTGLGLRRRFVARGRWQTGAMTGITNAGAGGSLLPLRFNSRAEVVLVTLRRVAR